MEHKKKKLHLEIVKVYEQDESGDKLVMNAAIWFLSTVSSQHGWMIIFGA